ncbi:Serine-rich coiled-coil domain-containing protein 1 [Triplophysa tibetana]|uniref:Serine-rich coiled-coil domain-containing protein 1 n=1 Tax=Triplophysa tibetana TaxID=1572043 RepID=A0A5A9NVV8_9TELE|nr:Serine-rich coiled-coil domain-containing protein 1 [Triplophysa tibetana]
MPVDEMRKTTQPEGSQTFGSVNHVLPPCRHGPDGAKIMHHASFPLDDSVVEHVWIVFLFPEQAVHPSRPTGQNNSSSLTRERRPARALTADLHGRPVAERATACEDRACATSSVSQVGGGLREPGQRAVEGGQTSSEVPATRKTDYPGPSQIPRVVAGSITSLPGKASPSRSLSSDSERGPCSERGPLPRLQTSFTGRLGQPPRGPLSLHMYSRKNVFLQHSLHTAELQALAQQDG